MKKNKLKLIILTLILSISIFSVYIVNAQPSNNDYDTYIVKKGDSLWKIAVKYQVGLSEIIASNPQIKNPDLIYPYQKINVPLFSTVKAIEKEVIELTNLERQKNGLQPLKHNWELSRVARYKSNDMRDNNYFSHTSPIYGSPFKMIRDFGINFSTAGENIAMGQTTAKQVVNSWMNSSGHRANILNKSFTEIGVGYAKDSKGRIFWTQMFIKP